MLQTRDQTGKARQNVEENGHDEAEALPDIDTQEQKPSDCDLSSDQLPSSPSSSASSSSTFFQRMSSWLNSRRRITSRSFRRKSEKKQRPGHMRLKRAKGFDFTNHPDDTACHVIGRSYVRVQESNGLSVCPGPVTETRSLPCLQNESNGSNVHMFNHNRIVVTESDDPNYVFIHNKSAEPPELRYDNLPTALNSKQSSTNQTQKRNMFLAVPMDTRYMPAVEPRERTPEEKRLPLTATASCPARSPTASETDLSIVPIKRSWTWPFHKTRQDERGNCCKNLNTKM